MTAGLVLLFWLCLIGFGVFVLLSQVAGQLP
jgi:hypothetical protein